MESGSTVLIIEDELRTAEWIKIYLERAGFTADIANNGQDGLLKARSMKPDLILLDLMLPRLNGMELCRILRRESDVPIIMLTARGAKEDRIDGFDEGADDYIVKPFDPDELVVRVKAVLRRSKGEIQNILTCGMLSLDESARQVSLNGKNIKLSKAQFDILITFMRHPNILLTRNQLIEQAFNNDFDAFDRAIDTHIRRLRKLIHIADFQPIQTIYGAGYKLVC
ncbi:MAG: response regulator transcription factor [Spirochaetaceae bacterium]|jgi:DNA-binding response OmpR family regulator|nr:response regulator transcription factor [Spirochaetaceae bacterium]